MNRTSIGSNNGLSPIWNQAIIWTNAELLSIGPLGTNFDDILIKTLFFIQENASENIVCEIAAILTRGRWVGSVQISIAREYLLFVLNKFGTIRVK